MDFMAKEILGSIFTDKKVKAMAVDDVCVELHEYLDIRFEEAAR